MKRLVVRKASAGSGKTFQLAYNFILLTLAHRVGDEWRLNSPDSNNNHRHILAITFTNKATDEMKRRIVREFAILAGVPMMVGQVSNYKALLIKDLDLGSDPDGEGKLQRAAERALRDLLFNYGEFNVSTIDAFFQYVLRSFAFEADLSGNYEVALSGDAIIENGIADTFMQAINADPDDELRRWMESFMSASLRNGKSFNLLESTGGVRSSLRSFIDSLTDENYQRNAEEINGFIRRENPSDPNPVSVLRDEIESVRERLKTRLMQKATILTANPELEECQSNFKKNVESVADGKISVSESICNNAKSGKLFLKKANPTPGFQNELTEYVDLLMCYKTLEELLNQIHSFGLFDVITENINRMKADANTILLSDTNTLLRRIIGDSPSPFLYERTGLRLKHFLIDEFQDTSRLQWENLRPLLLESVSGGNDNLIIGDVKQCIYRFRNSDPKLLGSELGADQELNSYIEEVYQSMNFRSAAEIVAFNYMLFPMLAQALGHSSVYPQETDPIRKNATAGYVEIKGLNPDNFEDSALDRMFKEICRELDPCCGNYNPSDIAVLVETNKQASDIIKYLLQRFSETSGLEDVQVMGDESLMLISSAAVRSVIQSMEQLDSVPLPTKVLENKHYRLSQSGLNGLSGEFGRRMATSEADPFAELSAVIADFNSDFNSSETKISEEETGSETLLDLVNRLISELSDDLRRQDSVYLYAFVDTVTEFMQNSPATVHEFLHWWQMQGFKTCISSSESTDAIKVMTIHKAKGLEYDCIHIPLISGSLGKEIDIRWYDCGTGNANILRRLGLTGKVPRFVPVKSTSALRTTMFADEYNALFSASVLDDLNVLYVAFTRPKRELIVSVKGRKVEYTSTGKVKSQQVALEDINKLLINALGVLADDDGTWEYRSGVTTSKIVENRAEEPDRPEPLEMPVYRPSSGNPAKIYSEVADPDE